MVNQSQLENVQKLLRSSPYLTGAEREEWSSLLAFMNDKQLSEFASILQSKENTGPAEPAPAKIVPKLAAPLPELDLPAGEARPGPTTPTPETPVGNAESAGRATNNSVSAFINRNFAATLHRPSPESVPPSGPSSSVPAPPSVNLVEHPVAAKEVPVAQQASDIGIKRIPVGVSQKPPVTVASSEQVPPPVDRPVIGRMEPFGQAAEPIADAIAVAGDAEETGPIAVQEEVIQSPKGLDDIRRINVATLRARGVMTLQAELIALCANMVIFPYSLR
jgi:hypothetical protein